MAEEIIIDIDISSYVEQLNAAGESINHLTKMQQQLTAAVASGSTNSAQQLQQVTKALEANKAQYSGLATTIQSFAAAKQTEASNSSISTNSLQTNIGVLQQLTAQYNSAKGSSTSLAGSIMQLKVRIDQQQSSMAKNEEATESTEKQLGKLFGFVGRGIPIYKAFETVMEGVNLSMKNNPVGVLITALTALWQIFGSNAKVAAAFDAALAGANKVVSVLTTDVVGLGKSIVNAFLNPVESVKKFAGVVKDSVLGVVEGAGKAFKGLINLDLKGFGDGVKQAFNSSPWGAAINGVTQYTKKIAGAAAEGAKAAIELDQLQVTTAKANAEIEKANNIIERNTESLNRGNKSLSERKKLATEIAQKEIESLRNKEKIAKAELDAARLLAKDVDQTQAMQAELIRLEQDYQTATEKLKQAESDKQLRITELLEKSKTDAVINETQNRNQQVRGEEEANRQAVEQLMDKYLTTDREKIEKSFNDELALIKTKGEDEIKLIAAIEEEKRKALEKYDNEQALKKFEQQQAVLDADAAARAELKSNREAESEYLALAKEKNLAITQEELEAEYEANYLKYGSYKEFIESKTKLLEKSGDKIAAEHAREINMLKEKQDAQKATLQVTENISNQLIGLVGKVAEAQGAGAEFSKALAFVQVLIQQAIAIANAVVGGTGSGAATGPGAVATTPAFIAMLVGSVTAVIGSALSLLSKPVPKYALGGQVVNVGGLPHAQGGTLYKGTDGNAFEVEQGEKIFVLKKNASEQIGMLGAFNQMFGGRSWGAPPVSFAASGGSIALPDGGFQARQSSNAVEQTLQLRQAITEGFMAAPQPVVSVKEINAINQRLRQSVNVSTL